MNVEPHRLVGMTELRTHLGALIAAVEAGESVCLTRRSRPVATVSPLTAATEPDLEWLQRFTDSLPVGDADAGDVALDLGHYLAD